MAVVNPAYWKPLVIWGSVARSGLPGTRRWLPMVRANSQCLVAWIKAWQYLRMIARNQLFIVWVLPGMFQPRKPLFAWTVRLFVVCRRWPCIFRCRSLIPVFLTLWPGARVSVAKIGRAHV